MPSQVELEDAARKAGEAAMLLGNPLLTGAFAAIEQGVVSQIKMLRFGPEESEVVRDKLMLTLQVIDLVKEQLEEYMDTATIAQKTNTEDM